MRRRIGVGVRKIHSHLDSSFRMVSNRNAWRTDRLQHLCSDLLTDEIVTYDVMLSQGASDEILKSPASFRLPVAMASGLSHMTADALLT
jgi:hypothetical protein